MYPDGIISAHQLATFTIPRKKTHHHPHVSQQQCSGTRGHTDQILQNRKLGLLNLRPQPRNFRLDPRIHLFDLQLLLPTLVPDSPFLQVEIESDTRLGTRDFFSETLFEFFDVYLKTVVFGAKRSQIVFLVNLELGFELGKIDFLGVPLLQLALEGQLGEVMRGWGNRNGQYTLDSLG